MLLIIEVLGTLTALKVYTQNYSIILFIYSWPAYRNGLRKLECYVENENLILV